MAKHSTIPGVLLRRSALLVWVGFVLVCGLLALPTRRALAQTSTPAPGNSDYCLTCHGDPNMAPLTLPNGDSVPMYVSGDTVHNSIHGQLDMQCQSCHTNIQSYPHSPISFNSHRELSRSYYQLCERCHSTNYDKTLDSMHATAAAEGKLEAPICTDCHGAHDVQKPDQPRAHISGICGQCHKDIYEQYKNSVHGSALIQENNPDVPVCTDCHGVHNIHDPRTDLFRVETPELCAGCHSNQQLMDKYNIKPNVYDLYKTSWHGVDVSVYKARWPTIWHNSAVCTDCHGVHDIRKTTDSASHVNPANMLATCQKCHAGAGPNWIAAWTGHNEISLQATPYLFYTKVFYEDFAYGVLWLSLIYVVLQIIHATLERIKRSA